MRARGLGLVALCVAVIGIACTRPSIAERDQSEVLVELVCDGEGGIARSSVDPYTAKITDRTKKFTWTLTGASKVVEARIVPKGTNPWPFVGNPDPLTPGKDTKSKVLKGGIPPGKYKYSIDAVCTNGAKQDTISVDPDMIIPT